MKNTFKIIFSFIFSSLLMLQAEAGEKLADSLLWEITGNGLNQPSYLTGTFHIMCGKDFAILPKVKKTIESTDQLYLEVNFKDPKELADMQKMMFSESLLSEKLTADQLQRLEVVLQEQMGMTIDQVDKFTMNSLLSMLLVSAVECPIKKFLDLEIHALAEQAGKSVYALETIKEQSEFLSKAYPDEFMLQQFELMDEYSGLIDQMVAAFKAEKLSALMDMIKDERFYNEQLDLWLLEVRNKNWVKKMPAIMQDNSTLFAVGAGHLPGKNGVIKLLREAGFSVQPVMN